MRPHNQVEATLRSGRTMEYTRSLTSPVAVEKLTHCLESVTGRKSGTMFQMIHELDDKRWTLCLQFTDKMLRDMPEGHIKDILFRYREGQEAERSKWRRLCKKYDISTRPLGVSKDRTVYQKRRYVTGRGAGKRLQYVVESHDLGTAALSTVTTYEGMREQVETMVAVLAKAIESRGT